MLQPAPARRATRAGRRAWAGARTVPGTLVWLSAVGVTGALAARMSPSDLQDVLTSQSTNLQNLADRPLEVMVGSALWDGHAAWWLLATFVVFHARAERWLGTARWLTVVLSAHVIGTLVSQGFVALSIARGILPGSMATVDDYGVSYTVAGAVGVLTYRLSGAGRAWYAAVVVAFYSAPFWWSAAGPVTFTDIGHLTAVLVGLAAFPLVPVVARGGDRSLAPTRTFGHPVAQRLAAGAGAGRTGRLAEGPARAGLERPREPDRADAGACRVARGPALDPDG